LETIGPFLKILEGSLLAVSSTINADFRDQTLVGSRWKAFYEIYKFRILLVSRVVSRDLNFQCSAQFSFTNCFVKDCRFFLLSRGFLENILTFVETSKSENAEESVSKGQTFGRNVVQQPKYEGTYQV
jgi:hypothetical protein